MLRLLHGALVALAFTLALASPASAAAPLQGWVLKLVGGIGKALFGTADDAARLATRGAGGAAGAAAPVVDDVARGAGTVGQDAARGAGGAADDAARAGQGAAEGEKSTAEQVIEEVGSQGVESGVRGYLDREGKDEEPPRAAPEPLYNPGPPGPTN